MSVSKARIAFLCHRDDRELLPPLEAAAFDWLSAESAWQADLLPFAHADRLGEFDGAWWYYSENPELPAAALDTTDRVKSYLEAGGKLLLSLLAARYVKPLGIDRAPDAVERKEEGFFCWNGYVVRRQHPIFEGLPKAFRIAETGSVAPFVNARWVEAPPENGRVLAIATWGCRFVEGERVIVEWDAGAGQVLAIGMHNFRFDGVPSENLLRLARSVFAYLTAPLVAELGLECDEPAIRAGAGYLGGHYADSVVADASRPVYAVVTGKAWKSLDATFSVRAPSGSASEARSVSPGEVFCIRLPVDVSDLTPGEHTAAVEVAAGDRLLAWSQQTFFVVPRAQGAGILDRHWLSEIRSESVSVEIDKATGAIWGLHDPSDERPVQFAANPDNLAALATSDHRWLGDLVLKYRFDGDTGWRDLATCDRTAIRRVYGSKDSVVVEYDPGPPEQVGPAEPTASERFSAERGGLNWRIGIRNCSQSGMVLGELAIPLALNTFFAGEVDLGEIYERKVMLHSFIGGSSSWVLAAPLGGRPPYLLIWCKEGTKFEAMAHIDDYGPRPEGWEGLINVFPYSSASRETRCWQQWFNGHSQAALQPGEELVLNFGMKLIRSYSEIGDVLFESGKAAVDVAPGMVLPIDMTGHLRVRCKQAITVEGDEHTEIDLVRTDGALSVYRLRFSKPGQHNVTIASDSGEATNLHFLAIEPIEKLARAHSAHIARDQQYRAPGRRDGMFLMWDSELGSVVLKPRHQFMGGGSDEIGFSEPLVLAWKNVVDPAADEVAALEYYIERFVWGGIQDRETFAVSTGITDEPDEPMAYDRSFNYPHLVNIYFALSKIAGGYGLTRFRDAEGYLTMAYRTALAYYTLAMYKDNARTVANFGESLYFDLVAALRTHGHAAEADELEWHISRKAELFLSKPYPYLSEFVFDTTGYADAYFLRKHAGGLEGAAPVVSVLRATRGRQHSWPWYGGDVRWGWGCSKYPWPDELCLNYMTTHSGRALLDHFHETGEIQDLRLAYGSYLAAWALVEPSGLAHNLYTWEPTRMAFDPWTSEMGCGLYLNFITACAYAVDDPDFGLIGYGCDVEGDSRGHISVIPRDGVAKRVRIWPSGIQVELSAGKIDRVDAEGNGRKLALVLRETLGREIDAPLAVRGLPEGNYRLSANFMEQGTYSAAECAAGLCVPLPAGGAVQVQLAAQPRDTLLRCRQRRPNPRE